MKTITFSNEEIRELIKFYEDELRKTEERLNTISAIIQKLNSSLDDSTSEVEIEGTKEQASVTAKSPKPATSAKSKATETAEEQSQKRGMKPSTKKARQEVNLKKLDWENFFYEQLKKKGDVMSISEFSDAAYDYFKLHMHKEKNVNYKIRTELNKLVNNNKLYKDRLSGVKGFAYGLPDFFKESQSNTSKSAAKQTENTSKKGSTKSSTKTSGTKTTTKGSSKGSTKGSTKSTSKSGPKQKSGSSTKKSAGKSTSTTSTAKTAEKQQEKEAVTTAEPTRKNEDPLAPDYILELAKKEDRPLTEGELTDLIFEKGSFKPKERKQIEKKVKENLSRLFNTDKKLKKYIVPDSRIPAYGLPHMFDESNNLKEDYKKKVIF